MSPLAVAIATIGACIPAVGIVAVHLIICDLIAYWPKIEAALLMEPRP